MTQGVEGQARDLPLDGHLHTNLSPDSDVPIDVYAALAVERGIAELAITDHVDFDPAGPAYAFRDYATRERAVRACAARWADRGVAIRFGAELTYEPRYEGAIRDHLAAHAYDFTIGSVHVGTDSPYERSRVRAFVTGLSLADVVRPYFADVTAAARSGLFDVIGHLDMVKRYVAPLITAAEFGAALELYEPVLRALVDTGTGLEVNSSGLRQPPRETYPAPAVVALYRSLGGDRVTAGSDAHRSDSFAYGLEDAYRAVAATGLRSLTFRRGTDPVQVRLPARLYEAGAPDRSSVG